MNNFPDAMLTLATATPKDDSIVPGLLLLATIIFLAWAIASFNDRPQQPEKRPHSNQLEPSRPPMMVMRPHDDRLRSGVTVDVDEVDVILIQPPDARGSSERRNAEWQ